ncbi:MAG: hypothetical protein QXW31_07380, partial [Nitrososphaerota archaeon]
EKKTVRPPMTHRPRESSPPRRETLEDVSIVSEEIIEEPAKKINQKMEDNLMGSPRREVLDEKTEEKDEQEHMEGQDNVLEEDEKLEDLLREPEIELVNGEDEDVKLREFVESAEELRNQLYRLKKLLKSEDS